MVAAQGRRYSVAPPFAPARYGLLTVVDQPIDPDPHWQAGIEFQPDPCGPASATIMNCPVVTIPAKSPTATGLGVVGAEPFTVYAEVPCSPIGQGNDIEDLRSRAVNALTRGEARTVETVFWTGTVPSITGTPVMPHLAEDTAVFEALTGTRLQTAATVVTTGAAVDVVEAIGLLEGALAVCYGGEGVIHVPATAVAALAAYSLLVKDGDRLRTFYGNRVAVYSSDDREGPTGANPAAGQGWFYATGAITLRRTGINDALASKSSAFDRSNNTAVYIAERTYVIGWDCCHLAAQVSLLGV